MKILNDIQNQLFHALSDGMWHSGTALGQQCGVSRTAIWKQVKQLTELGAAILSAPKLGYRMLSPIIPLNADKIHTMLHQLQFTKPIDFHVFASIHSTNRYLKETSLATPNIAVCCAETQTAGRGRFGRHWYSPFGENIYCSIRLRLDCDLSYLSGFGLVISLCIAQVLNELTGKDDIFVKWPNDLIWQDKKLCGTLIEIIAESNGHTDVVIGIGLNINSKTDSMDKTNKPWCALHEITGVPIDRNVILSLLIEKLDQFITQFMSTGFESFLAIWKEFDYLNNKPITITHQSELMSGTAKGVTKQGQLILSDQEGKIHYLSSGDTSLKH